MIGLSTALSGGPDPGFAAFRGAVTIVLHADPKRRAALLGHHRQQRPLLTVMEMNGPALGNSLERLALMGAYGGMLGARHGKHPGEPDFTPVT